MLIRKKKGEYLFDDPSLEDLHKDSFFVLLISFWSPILSQAQVKSLQRRLENLSKEACEELDKACGHELWRNLGFDAFDSLEESEQRERANYYYGQLQTVQELLGCIA